MSQIDWAKGRLKKTQEAILELTESHPPEKTKVLLCSHMEAKFISFAFLLKEQGYEVHLVSNLPTSLKVEFLDQIHTSGLKFYDNSKMSFEESEELIFQIVNENQFDFIFDDGGHTYSKMKTENEECICTEFTQSGINIASEQNLKIPVINLNSSITKSLVGNVYGTGISTLAAIQTITNISFHGLNVGIIGFGPVGLSCSLSFKGARANVFTYDKDSSKRKLAEKYGVSFVSREMLLKDCDLIITCTGRSSVISTDDRKFLKDGCILANVGHYNHEISLPIDSKKKAITDNIEQFEFDEKSVYLLSNGNLVNLAFGQGYPIQIIDLSFAAAVYAWIHFSEKQISPGLHIYPAELDIKYFQKEIEIYKT